MKAIANENTSANAATALLSPEDAANLTPKKLILIVDDSVEYLKVFTKILEYRYTVALAKSGSAALLILEQSPVDLILLDIEMPGMSGLELLKILKRGPVYSTIPVIFVTSHAQSELIAKAVELGAKGYIVKPFKEGALISKVVQVLDTSPGKMVAILLSRQLLRVENILIKIQILHKKEKDPFKLFDETEKLNKEALKEYDRVFEEKKYSPSIDVHLVRIYTLIKNEDKQALSRLSEFINALDVRDLAAD
jgi:CheY-like chemotaxis protein